MTLDEKRTVRPYGTIPVQVVTEAQLQAIATQARAMRIPETPTEMDEAIAWMNKRWGPSAPAAEPVVIEEGR